MAERLIPRPPSPFRVNLAVLSLPGQPCQGVGTNIILSNLPSVIHVGAGGPSLPSFGPSDYPGDFSLGCC